MRDLDVADLDGDGKQEILAAVSNGLVVALDCRCRKIWAKKLPSPPTVLKTMTPPNAKTPRIVVGCQDGSVFVLDGKGAIIRSGKITGAPTRIAALDEANPGLGVLLATSKGNVALFRIGE
jgi:hypothetical protein